MVPVGPELCLLLGVDLSLNVDKSWPRIIDIRVTVVTFLNLLNERAVSIGLGVDLVSITPVESVDDADSASGQQMDHGSNCDAALLALRLVLHAI